MKKEFLDISNINSHQRISDYMLESAKSRLVNICLVTLLITGVLVLPVYIIRIINIGWQIAAVNHFIILIMGFIVVIFMKKLSLNVRAFAFLWISLSSAYFSFASYGIVGSGFFGMGMMAITVSALVFGKNLGFTLLTATTIFIVLSSNLLFLNNHENMDFLINYLQIKGSWYNAIAGVIFPLFMLIMGIDEMHKIIRQFIKKIVKSSDELQRINKLKLVLFDTTDVLLILTDKHGIISDINSACENITGYTPLELIGKNFFNTFFEESKRISIIEKFNDISNKRFEDYWITKNKSHLINWISKPITLENGEIENWFISGIDVTEIKNLEKKLKHAEKMESIGKLAGGVAHDFNNMLTGIMGAAEYLHFLVDQNNSEAHQYIDSIIKSGQNSASLVRQLLNFARDTGGPTENINIDTSINDMLVLLKRSLPKNISLDYIKVTNEQLVINGENTLILNALLNLGINSRDAILDNKIQYGEIKYKLSKFSVLDSNMNNIELSQGEYAEISITDNGGGIPDEIMEHLFEPFYTTKEIGRGTGLGLASVYGTIKKLGGQIKVETEKGKGTKFFIYLPLIKVPTLEIQQKSLLKDLSNISILLIDDEEAIRLSIGGLLKDLCKKIILMENGHQGYDYLISSINNENEKIDLIILDWIMPKMNGGQFLQKIQENFSDIPVIISSGFGTDESILKNKKIKNRIKFLKKPYTQEEMLKVINESL